jgi:ribosomal protein S18 acetylase RimI-like enzyme
MPLPVLHSVPGLTDRDLVRLFHRTELHWTQGLADESALACGTALANAHLAVLPAANRILDAALPDSLTADAALTEVENHFNSCGSRCLEWIFIPSAAPAAVEPLRAMLVANGWRPDSRDILYLQSVPALAVPAAADLTIIPARASFRHMQKLADELAAEARESQLAEAAMLHLDDPHWDALLALIGQEPAGTIGVLAVGDIGRIEQLFVSPRFRRRGIGRTLLSRAMEICARSLFKHVMLAVKPEEPVIRAVLKRLNLRTIGQITAYRRPVRST